MVGYSTETFRESLHQLCRKPKHQYSTCPSDICDELQDKDLETLTLNNVRLHDDGIKCILKVRVANSGRNIGQSSGFRVITIGDREEQKVVLLYVFPKTGAYGISDINEKFLAELIKKYLNEKEKGSLIKIDLENKLAEII